MRIVTLNFRSEKPIESGESIILIGTNQSTIFRPEKLIIPQFIGEHFEVNYLRIGGRSCYGPNNPLPGSIFTEKMVGIITKEDGFTIPCFSPMCVGEQAEISIKNASNDPRSFVAVILGKEVENDFLGKEIKDDFDVDCLAAFSTPKAHPGAMETDLASELGADFDKMRGDFLRVAEMSFNAGGKAHQASGGPKEKDMPWYVLGYDTTTIPAYGFANITKRPQISFRPSRISIPDDIASAIAIIDVKVGKNSQFLASGEAPGTTFSDRNPSPFPLKADICRVSMDLAICLRNRTDKTISFTACVGGPAIE